MTSELETLRSLADRMHPPTFESLEEVARLRTRRTAVYTAVGGVLAVLLVSTGIVVATARDDEPDPAPIITPTPTPTKTPSPTPNPDPTPTHSSDTSMTPQEVVAAVDATLQLTGVSADDPDFRFSVWEATCHWCPKVTSEARGRPTFRALAITSDGYTTATYRRVPFNTGIEHAVSLGPGLLGIVDGANGYEWLVRDDGTITPLERDFDEIPATDPRLWFVCLGNTGRTGPGGQGTPFDARSTWCALDPKTDTIHVWLSPWAGTPDDSRSMISPESGPPAWGFRDPITGPTRPADPDPHLVAWWDVNGTPHHEDLGRATISGAIENPPPGVMSLWSWVRGSLTLTVFTSNDQGASWRTTTLTAPFRPPYSFSLFWTPGGDLIARQNMIFPDGSDRELDGLRIWRASPADGGSFEAVYEAGTGNQIAQYDLAFSLLGDRIWASRLWSDDDGRTWTEATTWRP
jgi:hypothetical protein